MGDTRDSRMLPPTDHDTGIGSDNEDETVYEYESENYCDSRENAGNALESRRVRGAGQLYANLKRRDIDNQHGAIVSKRPIPFNRLAPGQRNGVVIVNWLVSTYIF